MHNKSGVDAARELEPLKRSETAHRRDERQTNSMDPLIFHRIGMWRKFDLFSIRMAIII